MRLIVLVALCFVVAGASYGNRNSFNRLLRQLQRRQQMEQNYGTLGQYNDEYDNDNDEDYEDEESIYQQQQCRATGLGREQCSDQGVGTNWNQDQYEETQGQWQYGQQNQQQRRRQQQQCQPRFQLLQALEQVNTQLAAKLYQQAKQETDDKNTVVSPAALQQALAALQRGARGNTKRQLQRIISGGLNQQQTQQAHAALQQSLRGQDPQQQQQHGHQQAQIKTTTTIILNQQTRAQQQFVQTVQTCQNVQVKTCNFQRQPQQCRQQINRHVAQKTNQKLHQTVPQSASTSNTKMLVVNTAQLRANWGRQFRQQQRTKQSVFYPLGQQQPRRVQTLQSQGQFNYYEDEQVQVVGVPTQQQVLTLYVIVPKDKQGLNQVEKTQVQNGQQLQQILEQAEQQQENVQIELPKFQIKHKIDAKQTLRKQGAQDAFDVDEADFSGITGQQQQTQYGHQQQYLQDDEDQEQEQPWRQDQTQQLHVNKLIQQVTVQINEQGIRAANPTGQQQYQQQQYQQQYQQQQYQQDYEEEDEQEEQYWQQQWNRQQQYQQIFGQSQRGQNRQQYTQQGHVNVKVNRAFAFAIKHNPSNQIVMIGRVVDPTQRPGQQQPTQEQTLNGVDQQ